MPQHKNKTLQITKKISRYKNNLVKFDKIRNRRPDKTQTNHVCGELMIERWIMER
jgi:hypothetical protein